MSDHWSFCNHKKRTSRLESTKLKKWPFYEQFVRVYVKEVVLVVIMTLVSLID